MHMSFIKWIVDLLFSIIKVCFKDTFRSLIRNNVGKAVEINVWGEWSKSVILKVGEDYMIILMDNKQFFVPLSSVQGIRMVDS